MSRTAAIVNPRSGKTASMWPRIEATLAARLGPVEVRHTSHAGHATAIARELLEQGFERIIAAGGDGTVNEVANGFLADDRPVRRGACLGILPLGTGGDFQRTLGIPRVIEEAMRILAEGVPIALDVGRATFVGRDGRRQTRYFTNLASFGMGGDVAARSKNFLNPLGGTISYLWASAVSLLLYRPKHVRLRLDGAAEAFSFTIHNIAVGNGRFHGGGMQACPTAVPNDGVFEITVIEYLHPLRAIRDFPVLYSDNIYRHPKVKHLRASRLEAEADERVLIEVDGEPLGQLPLEISILPQVLPVLVSPEPADWRNPAA